MLKTIVACIIFCLAFTDVIALRQEEKTLKTATGTLSGTLTIPAQKGVVPVVLIIPGSGPVDRNGNSMRMQHNALLMLADSLAKRGIASLRYDKRGIGASKAAAPDESKLRFDQYVGDAADWISFLHKDSRFRKYYILGHSEGALIGMLAAKRVPVNGFISVSGPGVPADEILMTQLGKSPEIRKGVLDTMTALFRELKDSGRIGSVPQGIYQAFLRPTVQGYFASWMKYNPSREIAAIRNTPVLIVQGTTDLQVDSVQATKLAAGRPDAKLVFIPQMNHIFKMAEPGDIAGNSASYYEAATPIVSGLIDAVSAFIKGTKR